MVGIAANNGRHAKNPFGNHKSDRRKVLDRSRILRLVHFRRREASAWCTRGPRQRSLRVQMIWTRVRPPNFQEFFRTQQQLEAFKVFRLFIYRRPLSLISRLPSQVNGWCAHKRLLLCYGNGPGDFGCAEDVGESRGIVALVISVLGGEGDSGVPQRTIWLGYPMTFGITIEASKALVFRS